MNTENRVSRSSGAQRARQVLGWLLSVVLLFATLPGDLFAAQDAQAPPPGPASSGPQYAVKTPEQLQQLVAPIALYPDSLVAQILSAATFPEQVVEADRYVQSNPDLKGEALAQAVDQMNWDPSVKALTAFPSVLGNMDKNVSWTSTLGDAYYNQQQDVMDAVQRNRRKARDFGYLRSGPQVIVSGGPYIAITPVNPGFIVVPYYDPRVVYFAPRPGFFVGGAINFGFGITIGGFFRPWGWGYNRFDWDRHVVIINNAPWRRTWAGRGAYVHPYEVPRYTAPRYQERHELHEQSPREREAVRRGEHYHEEHDRR